MTALVKLVAKLTPSLKAALENAVGEAMRRRAAAVETPHWLFHILFGDAPELRAFLDGQGVDLAALRDELERRMPRGAAAEARPTISGSVAKLIETAWLTASVDFDARAVTPEILLAAALKPTALGLRAEPIAALGPLSTEALADYAAGRLGAAAVGLAAAAGPAAPSGAWAADHGALAKYAVNLTARARAGALDPTLGRSDEVAQILDVLLRKRQNNPILIGEPGVGKTAVVEGLAQKIAAGEAPEALARAELLALDLGLLQAGASVKGEFEERLKNVIKEVKASETPILMFIDEAHTLIGAGGAEGQNDAANLLKPALARGEFRTVAATTFAEYKRYFEKDPALTRRFQPITVAEPSPEAATHILRAVADGLSSHHGVLIQDAAITAAVDLSVRFLPARKLPDKAISLIDTACARTALSQAARPAEVEKRAEALRFAETALERAESDLARFGTEADLEALRADAERRAEALRTAEAAWRAERLRATSALEAAGSGASPDAPQDADAPRFVHPWVSPETVAAVISDWTGVPVSALESSEAERLLGLEKALKARVFGQDAAVEAIARSLKISRAGLTDARKPIGVFLLCGPSGVGKTETALAVAEQVFGGAEALTTINMTEFKEAHKTSALLGAPAGYVGYGKGGVLTEAVRRRPYSVLLLDEMEKAHPTIQDVFFQIFDKGWITDSEGGRVDFRNTIIVMTSNAGDGFIRDAVALGGAAAEPSALEAGLREALLGHFSPAFLGRAEVVAYRPLSEEIGAKLVAMHLERIGKRIETQYGASFSWRSSFVDYVVRANTDPLSGGRALEAIVNKTLLPRLAEACIARAIEGAPVRAARVGFEDGAVTVTVE